MKLTYLPKSDFLKYECDTTYKICLDICDKFTYDVTDSNLFYNLHYINHRNNFISHSTPEYGDVIYTTIFSYQIICHMICVKYPKTYYNIKPFKPHLFKKCCLKCKEYMNENDIHMIYAPLFGTEILEGNWKEILNIMDTIFINDSIYVFK